MNLKTWAMGLIDFLPSDSSSVSVSRADLRALVDGSDGPSPAPRDMTVAEVAEQVGRAESTVRGWLIEGALDGYKLRGRDWRVTHRALEAFLAAQATPRTKEPTEGEPVDLGAWRRAQ